MPILKNHKWLKKTDVQMEPYLKDVVLSGKKICFIRTRPYLEVDDTFEAFEARFVITKLEEGNLEEICQRLWAEAGYSSYNNLKEVWSELHKQYNPAQMVWVHYFERIEFTVAYSPPEEQ